MRAPVVRHTYPRLTARMLSRYASECQGLPRRWCLRRRLNRLVAAGWTVLHVTADDMRDPAALIARLEALLAAATFGK